MKVVMFPMKKTIPAHLRNKRKQVAAKKFLTQVFNNYRNFRKYVKGELL